MNSLNSGSQVFRDFIAGIQNYKQLVSEDMELSSIMEGSADIS